MSPILSPSIVKEWHDDLLREARSSAEHCNKAADSCKESPALVKALTANVYLNCRLGVPPDGIAINNNGQPYEKWLSTLWGRRCSYYISNLHLGLKNASALHPDDNSLTALVEKLGTCEQRLSTRYKRKWETQLTPDRSLIERGDIANFHVTYLDPVLFSSLYLLYRYRQEKLSWDKIATNKLLDLIVQEVDKSTNHGQGKNDQVFDESTVWWGFLTLLKHRKHRFELGGQKGWSWAVRVCKNLMTGNGSDLLYPKEEQTTYESTPEILGATRTRILVVKNCLEFAMLVPKRPLSAIHDDLARFVQNQWTLIRDCADDILGHMCLTGLALQVSSLALKSGLPSASTRKRKLNASAADASNDKCNISFNEPRYCVVKSSEDNPVPKVVRNLTAAEVATYRTKKSDYDILVDDKTVWIRKESCAEHQLVKLTPQQSMLLRLFLRYRQNQIDARDLFIKISGRKPETGISTADLVLTYLTTVITRFRKRMSMHIERTAFDVPYKVGSKEQTGYFCQGTFSSCLIYPQSFDSFLTIKTIPPPSK